MRRFVVALDQGTTSTRAIVFDEAGIEVASARVEHRQLLPRPGWVEHDPHELWAATRRVLEEVSDAVDARGDIVALGVTNQRETTIVWNRRTGQAVHNAIVWQDTRTQAMIEAIGANDDHDVADITGLPLAGYFSASKIAWILDHVEDARAGAEAGDVVFGTVDSWLVWNLTGGVRGGQHVTDATNASRTLLMDIHGLDWSPTMLERFRIPRAMMPRIVPSSGLLGTVALPSSFSGIPVTGIMGDQQAAAFGQAAFDSGESKGTYGTGNFVLVGTGDEVVRSEHGLLTTVAYQLGTDAPRYALEGAIAVTGSLVQWLRDELGLIAATADIEPLAASVPDNGGAYLVPAFSGLLAPHWRPDARGALVGLTRYVTRAHVARAALEATAFQTADMIEAIELDSGEVLSELRVDGGMVRNELLMQFQADILGIPVVRPRNIETTALGVAYAAGLALGVWSGCDELRSQWREGRRWTPMMSSVERERRMRSWRKAVRASLDWVDDANA